MINKIKEFSKKYLIGFTLGLLTSGIVVVCAATYFPSSQTTYDNKVSGLNAINVQTAIDELYNTCFPKAGEQIIEDAGLEKNPYECRYFFTGATPNNYITFNNEIWRIVSVECDETIKIIREASIGSMAWDSSNSKNWARPASLNTYLNESYLTSTLNTTAQSQIVAKDFSIGIVEYYTNDLIDLINSENSSKWNGKVALATVSEYIRSNSNKSSCGTLNLYNMYYSSCLSTTWMYNNEDWWTLSPMSGISNISFYVDSNGAFYSSGTHVGTSHAVRPTVYLSSDIKITGGNGSQSNPYTIE